VSDAVDNLRRTLDWVGLDYDEGMYPSGIALTVGIGAGGSCGPYTQSERLDIYQHHCDQLISVGPLLPVTPELS
jgi:glutamyl-tRNA synthetase